MLKAIRGEVTVKSLRETKRDPKDAEKPQTSHTSIKLEGVLITVKFASPEHSAAEVRKALQDALNEMDSST